MESNAKIFSGTGSQYLAEKIAKKFGEPLGKVNIQRFSDGEIYVEYKGPFCVFDPEHLRTI